MLHARSDHTATLLHDGTVLVCGGNSTQILRAAELYDPNLSSFVPVGDLNTERAAHTATLLADGRVLVAGGVNVGAGNAITYLTSAEIYDPLTRSFTRTGSMAKGRFSHSATLLADGRVLVLGGYFLEQSAEVFDPASGLFTGTGSLLRGRFYHTATLLQSGRVLVIAGTDGGLETATFSTVEIYDPSTRAFASGGSTVSPRARHTATLLPSGNVLVTGGVSAADFAELYDPAKATFAASGNFGPTRFCHTATLLGNGRVLLVGGTDNRVGVGDLSSAHVYDPHTDVFSLTSSLLASRTCHTATLMTAGDVLIIGGTRNDIALDTAELYKSAGPAPRRRAVRR